MAIAHTRLVQALRTALVTATLSATAYADSIAIPLSSLNGGNGFRLEGVAAFDRSGTSISSAGDVNGDGFDDVIIGAYGADPNGAYSAGSAYVVFGRSDGFAPSFPLSDLNGSNGFRLEGVSELDLAGNSVSGAGDVNGDGFDDVIVGAAAAEFNNSENGGAYVVFGHSGAFSSSINLGDLDGTTGFNLAGAGFYERAGSSVSSAGDINGDGFDDLIIGAPDFPIGDFSGKSYVVFGSSGAFTPSLALSSLTGSNGFALLGVATGDRSGGSVSAAGDINGDGFDDLIIGADGADPNGVNYAGSSYVVFGRSAGFASTMNLSALDGINGFRLDGSGEFELAGNSVGAAGDTNGDGYDDMVIGALGANANGIAGGSGYVIFGRSGGFAPVLALSSLNGSNGFRLDGALELDFAGVSVDGAGDVNGDGLDDLVIGARGADTMGDSSGSSYVVYGNQLGFPSAINLGNLDRALGFRLDGESAEDESGRRVSSAGDLNRDGVDEIIIGARGAGPNALLGSGSSYVVFGVRDRTFRDSSESTNLDSFYPRLDAQSTFIGSAVRWQNGATCDCDDPPFDFNIYRSGVDMAFFWPNGGIGAGVATGSSYAVLQPGAVIGPNSTFISDSNPGATANWRTGNGGYLGFRVVNPNTNAVNYGYALIQTTATTGYPAKIVRFEVNLTGLPVTIPMP